MPHMGDGMAVALGGGGDKEVKLPVLWAGVVEVAFENHCKVSYENKTVQVPHWKLGVSYADGNYSKKPAVYRYDKPCKLTAKISIDKAENVSGEGKLIGVFSSLRMEGKCPLSPGQHTVELELTGVPKGLIWYHGAINWGLEVESLGFTKSLNVCKNVEMFFIHDLPTDPFSKKGVPGEALRFLYEKAVKLFLDTDKFESVKSITEYCFRDHSLVYDCMRGAPSFLDWNLTSPNLTSVQFKLLDYVKLVHKQANCYDQASAVQALSGCLGIKVDWLYLRPFGLIRETDLLGWGRCNNPFFQADMDRQIVNIDDPGRTGFGNHAFCGFGDKVLDACGGPHLGTENRRAYVDSSIEKSSRIFDQKTGKYIAPFLHYGAAGKDPDIQKKQGVTGVS